MTADGTLPPPASNGRPHGRRQGSSAATSPPPPPPPNLIARSSRTLVRPAPAAAVPHPGTAVTASSVLPIHPLANLAQGLVAITVVFSLFSIFVPEGREPAPFVQFANGMTLMFFGLAMVAVITWLYRAASDVRKVGIQTRWSPLWAIFGWFLPPNLFIIPSLQMNELWKATGPPEASDGSRRRGHTNIWIWIWSGLYALSSLLPLPDYVNRVGKFLNEYDWQNPQNGQTIDFSPPTGGYWVLSIGSKLALALAGVALIVVIHQLSRRHDEFVGHREA